MWFLRHNKELRYNGLSSSMQLSTHCSYALIPYRSAAQTDLARVKGNLFDAKSNGHFRTLLFLTLHQYLTPSSPPSFCHLVSKYLLSTNYAPSTVLSIRNPLFCWFPGHIRLNFGLPSLTMFSYFQTFLSSGPQPQTGPARLLWALMPCLCCVVQGQLQSLGLVGVPRAALFAEGGAEARAT